MVESRLSGDERVVLSASPSQEAKRWKACPQVADVRIWPMPYEVIQQRMQFGAAVARTKLIELAPFSMQYGPVTALWRGRVLHMKGALTGPESATYFYQLCRIPERELDRLNVDPEMKAVYLRAKLDAGYWLGLIAAQQGNTRAAVDYLAQRTLKAAPGGPWTHGAA